MRMKANRFLKFLLVYNKSLELLSRLFHVENLELHNKILITTPRRLNGILFKSQIYSKKRDKRIFVVHAIIHSRLLPCKFLVIALSVFLCLSLFCCKKFLALRVGWTIKARFATLYCFSIIKYLECALIKFFFPLKGNGPSGISLSYFLAGNWPYWKAEDVSAHPDELLKARLTFLDASKSLVEHDLYTLTQGLEGRTTNPVSLLVSL